MTNFLDNLPPDIAADLARERIIETEPAASLYGYSVPHFRRLYRSGKVPKPIQIGDRKNGWKLGALLDDIAARTTPISTP